MSVLIIKIILIDLTNDNRNNFFFQVNSGKNLISLLNSKMMEAFSKNLPPTVIKK